MVQSIVIRVGKGKKVTIILRRWSSRGLGIPEVIKVPVFTANKIAVKQLRRRTAA